MGEIPEIRESFYEEHSDATYTNAARHSMSTTKKGGVETTSKKMRSSSGGYSMSQSSYVSASLSLQMPQSVTKTPQHAS
jgi:hypothetical protein